MMLFRHVFLRLKWEGDFEVGKKSISYQVSKKREKDVPKNASRSRKIRRP